MGLIGILLGLALLMWLAYRGWTVLMVAPVAASWPLRFRVSRFSLIGRRRSWALLADSLRSGFPCSCLAGCSAS